MKFRVNLDTDDYLIVLLLLIGAFIAFIGIYAVGQDILEWIKGSLNQISVR